VAVPHAGRLIVRECLITAVYLVLARAALMTIRRRASRTRLWARPTIIVGAGAVGESLAKRLLDEPSHGLRPVGYIDADPVAGKNRAGARLPLLGDLDNLTEAIQRAGAHQLIVAFSSEPDHELVQKLGECEQLGVEVSVVPRLYEAINWRSALYHVGGLPVLTLHPTDPHGWEFAVKHALDRTLAAIAVLALAPLMITIAIAVRLTSPGPVLFRQRRIGRDGHEFTLLKFRTMHEQRRITEPFAPPPGLAPGGIEGEDRRTRLGRFLRDLSLDELPQFINVLRGDMSLVGPRPERPEYVRKYAHEISRYQNRHRVKSGITGWAQVHGLRGQTSITDRVEYDNHYIQNWSLRLDLRILVLTIAHVMQRHG
jgi:exopolysaccharide biosynthesis polyprenyl glycosylphosphotransferase